MVRRCDWCPDDAAVMLPLGVAACWFHLVEKMPAYVPAIMSGIMPRHVWRTLPPGGRCAYADTEEEARGKAKRQAQRLGAEVGIESWRLDNPQDELNRGWALIDTVTADAQ